jgi:hypothetical protein
MKHTPGKDAVCRVCGANEVWITQEFPKLSVWCCLLHKAAPDLLEALELAHEYASNPNMWLAKAWQAITKAKGG